MPDDIMTQSEAPPARRTFRFGLKSLFILMTILCIWLGVRTAQNCQASEMVAVNRAVLEALENNVAAEPKDGVFVKCESLRQFTASFLKGRRPDRNSLRRQIASFSGDGRYQATSTFDVPLNVEKALAADSAINVSG